MIWSILDPTDTVIVTNEGEVYVQVKKSELSIGKDEPPTATLKPVMRGLLRRTFRWVGIVRRMYIIEEETGQNPPQQENIPLPTEDDRLKLKRW